MNARRILQVMMSAIIALLVIAGCGLFFGADATPTPIATVPPVSTSEPVARSTPEPASVAVAPTPQPVPPTDAPVPPTDTSVPPTNAPVPPTDAPVPLNNTIPIPTLEPPFANTIPGNGEYDDNQPYQTTANDPKVGENNGDGIKSVTFQFIGPDQQEVYNRTENSPNYCSFGGRDNGGSCNRWVFSEHNNQWPNGNPAQAGAHTLIVITQATSGGIEREVRHITLNLNQPESQTLTAEISPANGSFGDELALQVLANDTAVGQNNGDGIKSVTFQFIGSDQKEVYNHTENSASYCAFGGGDNGADCTAWRFSEHNNQWPDGALAQSGVTYTLNATVESTSGQQITRQLSFTLQL